MNKRLKTLCAIVLALGGYLLLLGLLVWAEAGREGALIDSLPKALWYSLVTLTTVGYGELYPVSPLGKVIGALFLLLSTGLLALLIGLAFAALNDRLLPRLRLWRRRKERWYVLSPDNGAARALAARLKDGVAVFCRSDAKGRDRDAVALGLEPEALFDLPFFGAGERVLFAVDDDPLANERVAGALAGRGARIYYRGDGLGEGLPEVLTPFNEYECCARLYWQSRPWSPGGERAALVGGGRYAQALLEQGLLTAPPGCAFELFGDWSRWRALHPALAGLSSAAPLRFHEGGWADLPEVLRGADRAVLCEDDRRANLEALHALRRACAAPGRLDALCDRGTFDEGCFGGREALFTPELVMRQAQNRLGRHLHELYRAQADYPVPPFEALSDFLKRSNLAAADHLLTKARLLLPEEDVRALTPGVCARAAARFDALGPRERERCRAVEHDRWALFYTLHNWRYAPRRNDAAREHPMLVPYEQLDEAERRKDDNPWLLLRTLSEEDAL